MFRSSLIPSISHINWLNQNVSDVSVLIVDEEIRGYAAFYIDMDKIILRDLGYPWYSNPNYQEDATKLGNSTIMQGYPVYLIARHFSISGYEAIQEGEYLKVYVYKEG